MVKGPDREGGVRSLIASAEHLNHSLKGKDILSVAQFNRTDLDHIYNYGFEMERIVEGGYMTNMLGGKILTNLFYEPSTRTSSSFASAMQHLGGSVISINEVTYSSVAKGENLEDTVSTMACYSNVIVLRHKEQGSAAKAAEVIDIPLINAGDGAGEHPTQALLDCVTVRKEQGRVDGLTITMVGDLKYGRTVHSLARLLSLYQVKINYVSPEVLRMPPEIIEELKVKGIEQTEFRDLGDVITGTDILYVTRIQKERLEDPSIYDSLKGVYVITPELLKKAKPTMSVMHPLPRVGEISEEVDSDPRAAYFREVENGLYVRMVLLAGVLGKLPT